MKALRACGLVAVLGWLTAGCTTDVLQTASIQTASIQTASIATAQPISASATVAFESIDGPPPAVFNRLVENLSTEAIARRIAIVSRESPASYRVRGYLAASVERGQVQISWVWDVYDVDKRRTLRISGEEPGSKRTSDAWAAADEPMLRKVAQTSMDRLVVFLGGSDAPPQPEPSTGPAIASASDPTSSAFGWTPALAVAAR